MTTATAHVFKNEVFRFRWGWQLIWNGQVPSTTWRDRAGAQTQLALLSTGYTRLCEDGRLHHVGATPRVVAQS